MAPRWFWYVSLPKLTALESQTGSVASLLEKLSISLELTLAKVKATVSSSAGVTPRLVRRLDRLERRITDAQALPDPAKAADTRPVFFEFKGFGGRFIQGAFRRKKPRGAVGEDFYPHGAFVLCGFDADTAVVLVGNANNMYGSDNRSTTTISRVSQTPIVALHRYSVDPKNSEDRLPPLDGQSLSLSAQTAFQRCPRESVARVRSIAVFGGAFDLHEPFSPFEGLIQEAPVTRVVLGSPLYVEQVGP